MEAAAAPVLVIPQNEPPKKCKYSRGRCNRNVVPTVVTGTPAQVEAAQSEVNKHASRMHVTSIALIALGLISAVGSLYSGLTARRGAEKWLEKAAMKHHGAKNATIPETKGPEYVSMAEFALVDNLRVIAFIMMCASCDIIGMGK